MIPKSGATFSNDFSKFVLGWHEEYSSSVVSNCPPQAQAGNWQLYIHTTSIYYQISQWVQILSVNCIVFSFLLFFTLKLFFRLNNVKNKIDRQTIDQYSQTLVVILFLHSSFFTKYSRKIDENIVRKFLVKKHVERYKNATLEIISTHCDTREFGSEQIELQYENRQLAKKANI